jgi:hypothetical protein
VGGTVRASLVHAAGDCHCSSRVGALEAHDSVVELRIGGREDGGDERTPSGGAAREPDDRATSTAG